MPQQLAGRQFRDGSIESDNLDRESVTLLGGPQVATADSPYTVLADDQILMCNTAGGALTVNLPAVAAEQGRILIVKDVAGHVGFFQQVILVPSGGDTIEGGFPNRTELKSFFATTLVAAPGGWLVLAHRGIPSQPGVMPP